MKSIINNWHNISLVAAFATLLLILLGNWNFTQVIILSLIVCMFLHFYEEFGFPGGFPYMGVKVLLRKDELDTEKWGANNLNSMFGNWTALILLYVVPLLFPGLRFLTLAAVLFSFLECFMHLVLFNVKLKSFYNPGIVTAVLGMTLISIYYFMNIPGSQVFYWYDYPIALLWCIAVFLFCFRSPLYWKLGSIEGYPFTRRSAFGFEQKKVKVPQE